MVSQSVCTTRIDVGYMQYKRMHVRIYDRLILDSIDLPLYFKLNLFAIRFVYRFRSEGCSMKITLKSLSDGLSNVNGDIRIMKGDIHELKADVRDVKGDILIMKGDIRDVKADIIDLKKAVIKVNGRVDTILSRLDDHIADSNRRFDKLECRFDDLPRQVVEFLRPFIANTDNMLDDHDKRISALEESPWISQPG
jgi:uncharacterized protein YoxC